MTNPQVPSRGRIAKSIGLSILALAIGFSVSHGLTLLRRPPPLREPVQRTYNVEVFRVEDHDIREIIPAFGTSRADREVVLSAQVAGEVAEVHSQLKVGKGVRAGEVGAGTADVEGSGNLLLRIDPATYEGRVTQSRTHLAEDRAELDRIHQEESNLKRLNKTITADYEDSQREYDKALQLRKQGVNTDSDLRRAQMDLRQHEKTLVQSTNDLDLLPSKRVLIERRIESHVADLRIAEIELARTSVRPPFDGILSSVQVQIGQYVRVGDPLVTVTDQTIIEIPLPVTLDDYSRLLPDVLAQRFPHVDLAENESAPSRWTGRVVRMSPKADEHTRTAMAFVQVDNTRQTTPLLPGTFVQARIEGPVLQKVKVVPRDAVLNSKAIVERDGVVLARDVTIRRNLQSLAVIDQGLDPGDNLVLTNLDVLFDGAKVRTSATRTLIDELKDQRSPSARLEDKASRVIQRDRDDSVQ